MTTHVLILCTHNSARSILAEAMLNHWAKKLGKPIQAHSAGSTPKGQVNPFALDVLKHNNIDISAIRSKSWDEFATPNAQPMHIVITVCDNAAAETCPFWPASPLQTHWGFPDPSNTQGSDDTKRLAFEITRQAIGYKMLQLLALPIEHMAPQALQNALQHIAKS